MKYQYNGKGYSKVIVWGAGHALANYEYMIEQIDYIVDKNPRLWKQKEQFFGLTVYPPEVIANEKGNILIVVTTSRYLEEIRRMAHYINDKADVEFITDVFINKAAFFGQYREDAIVEKLIRAHISGKIQYLEVGVLEPVNGSNTYHFYLNGGSGVCVEANPDKINELKARRPNDEILCCGCGAEKDEGTKLRFYLIKGRPSANTFSEESLKILLEKGFECQNIIEVPIVSLNTIIENYYSRVPDYISIDVEGYEYTILQDFDFRKYPVSLFCIEKGDDKVKKLMEQESYELVATTPANWIFMKKDWAKKHRVLLERQETE